MQDLEVVLPHAGILCPEQGELTGELPRVTQHIGVIFQQTEDPVAAHHVIQRDEVLVGIAILLIHHLRKEPAEDVFSRISGTTAISGAVDSSFTLVESKRGSGQAMLYCIGRDIEYREIELKRSEENIWEVVSDSKEQPLLLESRVALFLSEFMKQRTEFIGTPTELSQQIDPASVEQVTPKKVSRLVLQNLDALSKTYSSDLLCDRGAR